MSISSRLFLLSLSLAPALACGGSSGAAGAAATADLPPIVDCGRPIDALAPALESPAVVLLGDDAAQVPALVGDLACQVAASGKQVVVAVEPDDGAAAALVARVDGMRAAGLEVELAREQLAQALARVGADHPDTRLIALAHSVDDVKGVAAYAINVVGDAAHASAAPALVASPTREGGFDAVLDLSAAAPQ
ncbi:MAG TPA: hypothetical protein VM734_05310 [Kofleriaceae bacterium]|nr:hypothetical protein [Kofleriaceae bacterium]